MLIAQFNKHSGRHYSHVFVSGSEDGLLHTKFDQFDWKLTNQFTRFRLQFIM